MTVTRVVGEHEDGEDAQRRYTLDVDAAADATVEPVTGAGRCDGADASLSVQLADGTHWVTVEDGTGLARVRILVDDGSAVVRLPGPSFDERCTAAVEGDGGAARELLEASRGAVALAFAVGEFLAPASLAALLDWVTAADDGASDAIHAARYDLIRAAVTTHAGPRIGDFGDVEALASGLDDATAIGDVDAVDALADAIHVSCDAPGEARALLADLDVEPDEVAEGSDGRFLAYDLAHAAATGGLGAARRHAGAYERDVDYDDATARAERADYWDRGAAWRDAVPAAAGESDAEFAYVLANALYWTGEVGRGDSRAAELCFAGAAAAARPIDIAWVLGHARFERARAVGHRHRSSRNHALALAAFDEARAVADEYGFLDPWEPTYSRAVVASNRKSAAGDHEAAVRALEAGKDALADQDVPEERAAAMLGHLDAQRHERLAILPDDPETRLSHLETAVEKYDAVGFERSVERVREKRERARDAADRAADPGDQSGAFSGGSGGESGSADWGAGRGAPRRSLRASERRGPSLADIPSLHDFLTEPDPDAVGSADPGVLPDERGGPPNGPDEPLDGAGERDDYY